MYEAFYGLTSKPFQLNPDPSFYFGSKQHSRAKAYLEYGISRHEGFVVITGEIGAGKTTILRTLIDGLHGSDVVIGHIVTTQLGAEDTQRYIEHRLKRAGSQGKPSFEPAVFDSVFKASRGIPRRINSICDRLLLLGFLSEKTHLSGADVDEVVREFNEEAAVPVKPLNPADAAAGVMTEVMADADLSKIKLS